MSVVEGLWARGEAPRALRIRAGRAEHPVLAGAASGVALLSLLPLGFIVAVAIATGPAVATGLLWRPRVGELLLNTALLVLLSVPLATALALAQAWLVERTDLPGRRIWAWTAVAPLAVPAFVQSYAWVSLLPSLNGLGAAVLVSVLAYAPFVYLPVSAQLRRADPGCENAAASLGLSPASVFRRVVLPQLKVALSGGALLVGLHLLAEYGLFAIVRFDTFTTAIVDQFQSTFNGPAANMLGGVLVGLCCLLLWLDGRLRGRERTARVGSGAAHEPTRHRLGRLAPVALLVPAGAACLALGVPAATLGRWLAAGGLPIWRGGVAGALGQTLFYAAAGGLLTTVLAFPMAWLSVRAPGRWQRVLETCHYYVGSLPGVIVSLALVTITVRVALPLYQTVVTLLLAYALLFLPRSLVGLRGSIAQVPPELERAAAALGRRPARAMTEITLRLAAPGAAASAALAGLGITNELVATLMLSPNGTRTLATEFWALTGELDYAAAAPYALTMVILSAPLVVLLQWQSGRMAGR